MASLYSYKVVCARRSTQLREAACDFSCKEVIKIICFCVRDLYLYIVFFASLS